MKNCIKLLIAFMYLGAMSVCMQETTHAATKEIETEINEDYASAKFTIEFDEKGEYDITLTSPNKQTYSVPTDNQKVYEYTVQDFSKGKWKITISNTAEGNNVAESGETGELEETDGESSENTEAEESSSDSSSDEIGHARITVNGSKQALMDTTNENIVVAEEITGYKAYFINNILHAEWDDSSVGNVQVTVTDQKTQEMLDTQTVAGMVYECEVDCLKHPYIIVTVVPSVSAGKTGAEKSYTYTSENNPAASVEFEDIEITNRDSIKAYVELNGKYKVSTASLENGGLEDKGILEPGHYDIDVRLDEVGDNNLLVWITDPDTGYMKSWECMVEKDVTAPVLRLASSYESYTTENEFHVFEGSIDDTYDTFTINGADIKVEGDHTFRYEYSLKEGENNITILAADKAGNISEFDTVITRVIPKKDPIPWKFVIFLVAALLGAVAIFFKIRSMKNGGDGKQEAPEPKPVKKVKKEKNSKKDEKSKGRKIFEILDFVLPLIFVFVMMTYVIAGTTVESGSMEPKLETGTTAVYNRLAYKQHPVQRGDVICFYSDEFREYMGKRVIGLPGDEIMFRDGYVYINGLKCDESAYIDPEIETNCLNSFAVPDGCVFVMGDNREYSYDSRFFKNPYIPQNKIVGKYIGSVPLSIYKLERMINPHMDDK